jgi:riboflavin synthase
MFTGIIECLGTVRSIEAGIDMHRLAIDVPGWANEIAVGGSIAVNGACLTAVASDERGFASDVVPETLQRTNLSRLRVGDRVNLERPLRVDGRFDGHIVQGHVDRPGTIEGILEEGGGRRLTIDAGPGANRYLVEKGSVAVDGVSLTVASVKGQSFEVALIPHTLAVTTLGLRDAGDQVNLEFDLIFKYVENLARFTK